MPSEPPERAKIFLSHLPFFKIIQTGSPREARKAEGIQLILDSLSEIRKEEVIYVGDAPNDFIAKFGKVLKYQLQN